MQSEWKRSILVVLLAGPALAQGPPRFTVESVDGGHKAVEIVALSEAGALTFTETGRRQTLERWFALRRDKTALPPFLERDFALLTNGDRLPLEPAVPAVLEKNRLLVRLAKALPGGLDQPVSLYPPHVALLFWSLPDGVDDAERFLTELQRESRKRDVVHLKNGDRIEGSIAGLDKAGCISANGERKTRIAWADLAGIAFNTERQARLKTKNRYYRAVLACGARLNFLELRADEKTGRWIGKTQFGPQLEMPASAILAIDERQGQTVDLSDLTPTRYEQRPYLGVSWPLSRDADAAGRPLRLAGSTYEKGLATHASCSVSYKLDGKFQRFDCLVGIDADHSPRGRARLALQLDAKRLELNDGKELTARDAPLPTSIDLRGVQQLTLIIEGGSFGDVQAEVIWANARLVKRE